MLVQFIVHPARAPEPLILEYQTQQHKLLPLVGAAYAYHFTGQRIRADYLRIIEDIQRGDVDALPEVSLCAEEGDCLCVYVMLCYMYLINKK